MRIFVVYKLLNVKNIIALTLAALLIAACSTTEVKENINKAGHAAGETAGEFIEGAVKGVKHAFDVTLVAPASLKEKGIEFGKATVSSDSTGTDNLLVLYVIFNKDFEGKLTAKAYDQQSLEMGRAAAQVKGKAGEAKFFEFHFDKRTNIGSKDKLEIE